MWKKRNDPKCDPWDSLGNEKMQFLLLLLFALTFDQKWKYNFRGMQNRKPFEIILHVGQDTSLQSWVAKKSCHGQTLINKCSISDYPSTILLTTLKACNSPYMQYYFKRGFFCFAFLKSYIFIADQKVKAKSNRNRNCIFSFPWESQGWHIGSFLLCFTYPS